MSKLKVGDLVESIMTSKIGIVIEIYYYNNSMLRVFTDRNIIFFYRDEINKIENHKQLTLKK